MTDHAVVRDYPFELHPLSPALGAEVRGLDPALPMDEALFEALYAAFLQHQLLLFRDCDLPGAAQVAFARRFGEVQIIVLDQYHDAELPELFRLSNLDADGKPSGAYPDKGTLYWHTDHSWSRVTGHATFLYCEIAPGEGGETSFADMYGAYDLLSTEEQQRFATMRAVHDFTISRARRHGEDPLTPQQRAKVPPVDHPVIRIHPETGRKCVYLGDHAHYFAGMEPDAGRAAVEALNARITAPELGYTHHWRDGDFALWDNRCTLHRVSAYDAATQRRVIRRCTTLEQYPNR